MKFWQAIVLYLFFRNGAGLLLAPVLGLTGTPFMVANCLATLALGALMLAGNAPARRMLRCADRLAA